jgi:acyl-coenzyme A synthetase/AMP-(fatty) acid ligase
MAQTAVNPEHAPLITHGPAQTLAWRQGDAISASTFAEDVHRLAAALPQGEYVVNLCEDRYRFMVGFAAAMQRGLITLLPPNNTAGAINELLDGYRASYCLSDTVLDELHAPCHDFEQLRRQQTPPKTPRALAVALEQQVAILFTSGSTGLPKANPKRWINLYQEAISAYSHFPFQSKGIKSLLATVPSQHMYGLATAIAFPWQGGFAVDTGRPFFPADIAHALDRLPAPRVLITTPLHLRACVSAGIEWPAVAFVISATAPLSQELAAAAEAQLKTEIYEIYGSTETGSVAGRRTAREDRWHLYAGIALQPDGSGHALLGGHVTEPVHLNDRFRIESPAVFQLLGRDSDMVKIAGKRASLGHLNHQLLNIPGVEDGLFLAPDNESARARLTALVVAPTLDKQRILDALAHSIDAVFLPRPLYLVERLPRNETGKIPRSALQALLRSLQSVSR